MDIRHSFPLNTTMRRVIFCNSNLCVEYIYAFELYDRLKSLLQIELLEH